VVHPIRFLGTCARFATRGGVAYWAWLAFLAALIVWGGLAYYDQLTDGLIVTAMRDQVSWAFYIGNFTFLVGVAAAAVVLVIPAYIYHWKPIKEVVKEIDIYYDANPKELSLPVYHILVVKVAVPK